MYLDSGDSGALRTLAQPPDIPTVACGLVTWYTIHSSPVHLLQCLETIEQKKLVLTMSLRRMSASKIEAFANGVSIGSKAH